jgi:hypothetical protein
MTPADHRLVGMALGAQPPEGLLALCRELGRRAAMVDAGDLPGRRGPLLHRVADPTDAAGEPLVAWVDGPADVDEHARALAGASLVLGDDEAALAAARERGLVARLVPATEPHPGAVPVAPFVRARVRAARGVPGPATLVERDGAWHLAGRGPLPPAAVESALGLASAAVVDAPDAVLAALAWGCPTVTGSGTAAAVGAVDDRDCVVVEAHVLADADSAHATAARVGLGAGAARLGWHGRLLYERRHSLRRAADDVLLALGAAGRWAPSRVERELEQLDTHRGPLRWVRETTLLAGIPQIGRG